MTAIALLAELRLRGVDLTVEGGHLRYRAPKGVLTPDLRTAMAEHKVELLTLLTRGPEVSERLEQSSEVPSEPSSPAAQSPEVLSRKEIFDKQIPPGGPARLLTLPGSPAPRVGRCISCDVPVAENSWRCAPCRHAAALAVQKLVTEVICNGCGQSILRAGATQIEDQLYCPTCCFSRDERHRERRHRMTRNPPDHPDATGEPAGAPDV